LSPARPSDPGKGKAAGSEQAEQEAKESAREATEQAAEVQAEASEPDAAAEPATSEPEAEPATPEAEGTAAAETGVDKTAAQAVKPTRSAPARRRDKRPEVDPDLVVRAQAKYVRTSARKARLVCDHIRGKDVTEAQAILAFTPRAVAKPWSKLLTSAIANAEHNHELVSDDLRVVAVYADEGPTIKRFRPRAMGRATSIRKRTSHLTIALGPKTGSNRKGGR
jgi:ribosomal protein L22